MLSKKNILLLGLLVVGIVAKNAQAGCKDVSALCFSAAMQCGALRDDIIKNLELKVARLESTLKDCDNKNAFASGSFRAYMRGLTVVATLTNLVFLPSQIIRTMDPEMAYTVTEGLLNGGAALCSVAAGGLQIASLVESNDEKSCYTALASSCCLIGSESFTKLAGMCRAKNIIELANEVSNTTEVNRYEEETKVEKVRNNSQHHRKNRRKK